MSGAPRSRGEGRGGVAPVFLLLSLLAQAAPGPPADLSWARFGEVLVIARKSDLNLGLGMAEAAAAPREWYGLGRRASGPLRLIVTRGESGPLRGRVPSWGAGFAFPGARTIVVRADAGDPYQILRHELAHLALHDGIRVRVPLWFDEGYAALAAGELDRLDALRLNFTVARGRVPGFFELDRALRDSESTARAAYGLAASAVALLARRHPTRSLAPLLDRLAAGEGFAAAVLATTGSPLGRFELEWQKDVRKRFGIFTWVMAAGLWIGVAFLVVLAGWLRRRRDRPRRRALDEGWIVETDPEPPAPLDEPGSRP